MPAKKVKGGYTWGDGGTVYPTAAAAERANAAVNSSSKASSIYWPARKPHSKKKPG